MTSLRGHGIAQSPGQVTLAESRQRLQVPFFGDQPFWGDCCHRAGVGPRPVPIGRLRAKDLLEAFEAFDAPEVHAAVAAMAERMGREKGAQAAVQHFHECAPTLHRTNA